MKKITTLLLALLLCCCLFTACEPVTDSVISTPDSSIVAPDSSIVAPDSSIAEPDSSVETPDSSVEEPDVDTLEDAIAVINSLYKDDFRANPETAMSYKVVAQVMVGITKFPITWSIEGAENVTVTDDDPNDMWYNVNVTLASTVVNYVLKATVTDGTDSLSTSYNLSTPANESMSIAEALAAEDGTNVIVSGVVKFIDTALFSFNI